MYVILGDVLTCALTYSLLLAPECHLRMTSRMAEGVGFEPTVGCPTLDFESSALNRTQPPFRIARYCRSYFTMRNCRTRLRVSKGRVSRDLTIRDGCCGTDQGDIEALARGIQA
jgi:hypothetical protein